MGNNVNISYNELLQLNEESLAELKELNSLINKMEAVRDEIYNTQAKIAKICGRYELEREGEE